MSEFKVPITVQMDDATFAGDESGAVMRVGAAGDGEPPANTRRIRLVAKEG